MQFGEFHQSGRFHFEFLHWKTMSLMNKKDTNGEFPLSKLHQFHSDVLGREELGRWRGLVCKNKRPKTAKAVPLCGNSSDCQSPGIRVVQKSSPAPSPSPGSGSGSGPGLWPSLVCQFQLLLLRLHKNLFLVQFLASNPVSSRHILYQTLWPVRTAFAICTICLPPPDAAAPSAQCPYDEFCPLLLFGAPITEWSIGAKSREIAFGRLLSTH